MKPTVSVSLMTYNQEKYINQCIDSIISQITDFDFEIVIGDDASTDATPNIIYEYTKNCTKITFIQRKENIGLHNNFMEIINHCKGDYIALMEGDDFWIDPYKLQKQKDILDEHPQVAFCFGNSITFTDTLENGKKTHSSVNNNPFDLHDYMKLGIRVPNNTKMFRMTSFPKQMPLIFYESIQWDWLLHIFMLLQGKAYYIDSTFLAYRRHENAIISDHNLERILQDAIYTVYNINKYIPEEFHVYFNHPLYELNALAFYYLKTREFSSFFKYYFKWLRKVHFSSVTLRDELYKMKINLFK